MSKQPDAGLMAPMRLLLPKEHGAWVFLLLPMTVGLLARPSGGGAWVALGALAVFFARVPFQAGRRGLPMTLAGLGLVGFSLGAWWGGWVTIASLAAAGVLGLPLLGRSLKEMRNLFSESLALLACAALLPAILGAGGAGWQEAWGAWLLTVLLALPPLVHLRHRLALARNGETPRPSRAAVAIQLAVALLALGLWRWGLTPGLVPLWTLILLVRNFQTQPLSARRLGWLEAGASLGHFGVLWFSLSGL